MNASGNENNALRLTSETADYFLAKEHRERLMRQGTHVHHGWLKIVVFVVFMALTSVPWSTTHAQLPWQIEGEGDFFHPAIVEYKLGLFHLVREEWPEAIARFDRAVALLPEYAAAFEARGYCYEALGDVEQAAVDYLQAIYLTPDYAPTYKRLADLYYEQGEQVQALENYRMYVSLTGEYEELDEEAVERVAELEAALG